MSLREVNKAMERLQIRNTKYVSSGLVTGSIPPEKVATYIVHSTNLSLKQSFIDSKDTDVLDKNMEKARYWVCIRNHQNGIEAMHSDTLPTKPHSSLIPVLVSKVFDGVNLFDKFPIPDLDMPTAKKLWAQTSFVVDGHHFTATIFRDPYAVLTKSLKTIQGDFVSFSISTPWLPRTIEAYQSITSTHSRRLIHMHYALYGMLVQNGFKVTQTTDTHLGMDPAAYATEKGGTPAEKADHQKYAEAQLELYSSARLLYGANMVQDAPWVSLSCSSRFISNEMESTSGSAVIPALLSRLYPYILALDDGKPVDYQIIQPCKYTYAFLVNSLAGCKIWGSVNMYPEHEDDIRTCFQEYEMARDVYTYRTDTVGRFANALDAHQLTQIHSEIKTTMNGVETDLGTRLSALPKNKVAVYQNIENLKTPDKPKETNEALDFYMRFRGLQLLSETVADILTYKQSTEVTRTVDDFILNLLRAHTKEPHRFSENAKDVSRCVDSMINFVSKLIDATETDVTSKPSARSKYKFDVKDFRTYLKQETMSKSFTFDQGLSFLKSCIGSTSDKWIENVKPQLGMAPHEFLLILLFSSSVLSIYFRPITNASNSSESFFESVFKPYIFQNGNILEGSMVSMYYTADSTTHRTPDKFKNCILYLIFSGLAATDNLLLDKYMDGT